MMPATCVPWPYASPDVTAPGFVTAEAMTRDPVSPLKSGMSPAMPVSMTATPTPLPVYEPDAELHARSAWTEAGYAVCRPARLYACGLTLVLAVTWATPARWARTR